LIEELDQMYPDVYPEYTLPEKTLAFQAGAISIIRYLKGKTQSCA
jgi:hypothetical protein